MTHSCFGMDCIGYQALLPRLQAVQARHAQNLVIQKTKQKAVTSILGQYNEYVGGITSLFTTFLFLMSDIGQDIC